MCNPSALRRCACATPISSRMPASNPGSRGSGDSARQVDLVRREDLLRQPAGAAASVLPHILQDIGHLQTLRERHGEVSGARAILRRSRGILAKQLREHLADHARHVIAVLVEIGASGQALEARGRLKPRHSVAHEVDATLDGGALRRRSSDAVTLSTRTMLMMRSRSVGERAVRQAPRRRRRPAAAASAASGDDGLEPLQEGQRLGGRERRLVLDGVGDPAQQVGIGHRHAQGRRAVGESSARRCAIRAAESGLDNLHLKCRNPYEQSLGKSAG